MPCRWKGVRTEKPGSDLVNDNHALLSICESDVCEKPFSLFNIIQGESSLNMFAKGLPRDTLVHVFKFKSFKFKSFKFKMLIYEVLSVVGTAASLVAFRF